MNPFTAPLIEKNEEKKKASQSFFSGASNENPRAAAQSRNAGLVLLSLIYLVRAVPLYALFIMLPYVAQEYILGPAIITGLFALQQLGCLICLRFDIDFSNKGLAWPFLL